MSRVAQQRRAAIAVAIAVAVGSAGPALFRLAAANGFAVSAQGAFAFAGIAGIGCAVGAVVGLRDAFRKVRTDRREVGLDG